METAVARAHGDDEDLVIESMALFERTYGVTILSAIAVLFVALAVFNPTRGHEIGFVVAGLNAWWALYFWLLPRVSAVVGPDGFEFLDMRLACLFRYPRYRVAWRDVLDIESHTIFSRYGNYVVTRVKSRVSEVPEIVRSFTITSRRPGYYEFLRRLQEHIEPADVTVRGLGIEPIAIRAAARRLIALRLRYLMFLGVASVVLVILAWLRQR